MEVRASSSVSGECGGKFGEGMRLLSNLPRKIGREDQRTNCSTSNGRESAKRRAEEEEENACLSSSKSGRRGASLNGKALGRNPDGTCHIYMCVCRV